MLFHGIYRIRGTTNFAKIRSRIKLPKNQLFTAKNGSGKSSLCTAVVDIIAHLLDAIEENKTVAVSTHGCIKRKEDKIFFQVGLARMVQRLSPQTIVVYGSAPDSIFKPYRDMGINIISFESEFSKSGKQVTA